MSPSPPSGHQYVLTLGVQRAVVTEVGAGLRSYAVDGRDVIDGYREDEVCPIGRGQVLLPWPNRIEDGQYEFGGTLHQTPLTEPTLHNALHGLTRWLKWTAVDQAEDRVLMSLVLDPQDGYPFTLRFDVDYRLSAGGLALRTTAKNVGRQAAPFGAGHHPYITVGTLIDLFGAFIVIFGYFWISEAIFSGQTLGKRALRLRVVGDRGEPLTWVQAGIRNVIRIVDFLPYGYGVGVVVLFANGRGKRLGDLAAGTIVVKDSDHVWLWQLARATRPAPPPPPPPPGSPPVAMPYAPASQAELILRRIDPDLRRFVTSYARRRPQLPLDLRVQLAATVQASLRAALPDVFTQGGPLAALDRLADLDSQ